MANVIWINLDDKTPEDDQIEDFEMSKRKSEQVQMKDKAAFGADHCFGHKTAHDAHHGKGSVGKKINKKDQGKKPPKTKFKGIKGNKVQVTPDTQCVSDCEVVPDGQSVLGSQVGHGQDKGSVDGKNMKKKVEGTKYKVKTKTHTYRTEGVEIYTIKINYNKKQTQIHMRDDEKFELARDYISTWVGISKCQLIMKSKRKVIMDHDTPLSFKLDPNIDSITCSQLKYD